MHVNIIPFISEKKALLFYREKNRKNYTLYPALIWPLLLSN